METQENLPKNSIVEDGHRAYVHPTLTKNPDAFLEPQSEYSTGFTPINPQDIGRTFHLIMRYGSEMRYRNPWNVRERLYFSRRWIESYGSDPTKKLGNALSEALDAKGVKVYGGYYGEKVDGLIDDMVSEGLHLLGMIEEQYPGITLFPELPFMASGKDKNAALSNIMRNPTRMRRPIQKGEEAIMPMTADIVNRTKNKNEKIRVIAYPTYAIPDLAGFIPKTDEAAAVVRRLNKVIYKDNEGGKNYMLNPKFLVAHQDILREVLELMRKQELELHVIEMKTNARTDVSLTKSSLDQITQSYSHDIGHTLLVMMKVFESVEPDLFKGKNRENTILEILDATKFDMALIDCPTLDTSTGKTLHVQPTHITSRLLRIPPDRILEACDKRLKLNRSLVMRTLRVLRGEKKREEEQAAEQLAA